MAPVKEPHYFSPHLFLPPPQTLVAERAAYQSLFANASQHRWIGEASPSYLYSPDAAAAICATADDPRIVIALRHPVDHLYSMYWLRSSNALHHGYASPRTFGDALDQEEEGGTNCALLTYREVARVAGHVARWVALFGRERVHIMLQEDLACSPILTWNALCAFLSITPAGDTSRHDERVAPSQWTRSRLLARWLWRVPAPVSVVARALLPAAARARVKGLLRRVNAGARPPVDAALRRALTHEFSDDIRHLSDVIGRDLSHWLA